MLNDTKISINFRLPNYVEIEIQNNLVLINNHFDNGRKLHNQKSTFS